MSLAAALIHYHKYDTLNVIKIMGQLMRFRYSIAYAQKPPLNVPTAQKPPLNVPSYVRERSGSVVECLTRDREAAGSSLTGVTALWSLSKTHLS